MISLPNRPHVQFLQNYVNQGEIYKIQQRLEAKTNSISLYILHVLHLTRRINLPLKLQLELQNLALNRHHQLISNLSRLAYFSYRLIDSRRNSPYNTDAPSSPKPSSTSSWGSSPNPFPTLQQLYTSPDPAT